MRKGILICLGILFLFNFIAKGQNPEKDLSEVEWITYQTEEYSIDYPETWLLDKKNDFGADFVIYSPAENVLDDFYENINLLSEDLQDENLTLEDFVTETIKQLKTIMKDFEVLSNEVQTINNLSVQSLSITGKQGEADLRFEQYYSIVNNKVYVLTFTCDKYDYEIYKEVSSEILESFKVNPDFKEIIEKPEINIQELESDWLLYTTDSYSISYPKDWELNTEGLFGSAFFLFSEVEDATDSFRENINLRFEDVSMYDITLSEYMEVASQKMKEILPNSELVEQKSGQINGFEVYETISNFSQGDYELRTFQYCLLKDGKVHVLTFTSERSKFETYKSLAESIMNTYIIK